MRKLLAGAVGFGAIGITLFSVAAPGYAQYMPWEQSGYNSMSIDMKRVSERIMQSCKQHSDSLDDTSGYQETPLREACFQFMLKKDTIILQVEHAEFMGDSNSLVKHSQEFVNLYEPILELL